MLRPLTVYMRRRSPGRDVPSSPSFDKPQSGRQGQAEYRDR